MDDKPEIPEPERAPSPEDKPLDEPVGQPHLNGGAGGYIPPPQHLDNEKLIAWMKATDKELKLLKINQLVLSAAVLFLLFASAKGLKGGVPKLP